MFAHPQTTMYNHCIQRIYNDSVKERLLESKNSVNRVEQLIGLISNIRNCTICIEALFCMT